MIPSPQSVLETLARGIDTGEILQLDLPAFLGEGATKLEMVG